MKPPWADPSRKLSKRADMEIDACDKYHLPLISSLHARASRHIKRLNPANALALLLLALSPQQQQHAGQHLEHLARHAGASVSEKRSAAQLRARVSEKHLAAGASVSDDCNAIAYYAAKAVRSGHAYVAPSFLSAQALKTISAGVVAGHSDATSFISEETGILVPENRHHLDGHWGDLVDRLDHLRIALARHTWRTLLPGGELHAMRYFPGEKFMLHADEEPWFFSEARNSISFLIYVTPDVTDWPEDDGGQLRILEGEKETPREILPVSGTLVIFDSTLYHEVLPTRRDRYVLSGRFRELDKDWQRRRV